MLRAMSTKLRKVGATAVLEVEGKLKMGDAVDQFRARWTEAIGEGARVVVINLQGVPMIDSSGLGSLMRCYSSLHAVGGKVKLAGSTEVVRQLLAVTQLERLFEFYDDENTALASVAAASA